MPAWRSADFQRDPELLGPIRRDTRMASPNARDEIGLLRAGLADLLELGAGRAPAPSRRAFPRSAPHSRPKLIVKRVVPDAPLTFGGRGRCRRLVARVRRSSSGARGPATAPRRPASGARRRCDPGRCARRRRGRCPSSSLAKLRRAPARRARVYAARHAAVDEDPRLVCRCRTRSRQSPFAGLKHRELHQPRSFRLVDAGRPRRGRRRDRSRRSRHRSSTRSSAPGSGFAVRLRIASICAAVSRRFLGQHQPDDAGDERTRHARAGHRRSTRRPHRQSLSPRRCPCRARRRPASGVRRASAPGCSRC